MESVFIIRYEEKYSDGSYASGIVNSSAYKDLESAQEGLTELRRGELSDLINGDGLTEEEAKSRIRGIPYGDSFTVERSDSDYTKYVIEEVDFYEGS